MAAGQQPRSTMLRDQIIAALKAAYPRPLTTIDLAEQLPPIVVKIRDDCRGFFCGEPPPPEPPVVELLECHKTWHLVRRRRKASDIHRHLVALARSGHVIRLGHNTSAHRSEPWTVEPDPAGLAEADALERAWAQT